MQLLHGNITGEIIEASKEVAKLLRGRDGYSEENYIRALAIEVCKRGLHVREKVLVRRKFEQHGIGETRVDIIVENKVLVAVKHCHAITEAHLTETSTNMLDTDLPVGFIVNFSPRGVEFKRAPRR